MLEEGGDQVAKQGLSMRGVPAQVSVFASSAGHGEELEVDLGRESKRRVNWGYSWKSAVKGLKRLKETMFEELSRAHRQSEPFRRLPDFSFPLSTRHCSVVLFSWIYSQANTYIYLNKVFVSVAAVILSTNQTKTRRTLPPAPNMGFFTGFVRLPLLYIRRALTNIISPLNRPAALPSQPQSSSSPSKFTAQRA
jgi:hypothetical protein